MERNNLGAEVGAFDPRWHNPSAKLELALIGEAPGSEEVQAGVPFVGRAGRLLDICLMDAGIVRSECYIDNLVHFQPPGNKITAWFQGTGYSKPNWIIKDGMANLKLALEDVQPNLAVAFGNATLWALTGEDGGITKKRGSLYDSTLVPGLKVLATIHPSYYLHRRKDSVMLQFDLHRAAVQKGYPERPATIEEHAKLIIDPSFEEVIATMEDMLAGKSPLSYDIETSRHDIITHIGLCDSPDLGISIPFVKEGKNRWSLEEEREIVKLLSRLLSSNKPKVGQNLCYDIAWLARYYGIYPQNLFMDTMLAHHAVYPELPKGLDFLSSTYTYEPYYKADVRKWTSSNKDKEEGIYNCKDAIVTYQCSKVIAEELIATRTKQVADFDQSLVEVATYMQLKGIRVDEERFRQLRGKFTAELNTIQEKLDKEVGHPVNANSTKQVKEVLFGELGLPPKYSRKTGNLTTDEASLVSLMDKTDSSILRHIIEIRKLVKLISTYIEMPRDIEDGRMRCSFNIAGTTTGRWSTSSNAFWSGGNLQNIPKHSEKGMKIRECFIPDEGYVFLDFDLVQAEAMVVAWEANEVRLKEAFLNGEDVHSQVASMLFGRDMGEVGKGTMERFLAKKVVHATNYGMGPRLMKGEINKQGFPVTEADCKALIERRFQIHPMIIMWHRRIQEELRKSRTLTTVFGRRMTFNDFWGDGLFRAAYAFRPQSTVADLLNRYLLKLYRECPHVEPLLQVHDSVLCQVREECVSEVVDWIAENLHDGLRIGGDLLVIPIEVETGSSWGNMGPIK